MILQWESSESDFSDTENSNELGTSVSPKSSAMDTIDSVNKRQATRVFKKSSLNGKITVYLGKRDFVDHITHVDPIGKYPSQLIYARSETETDCIMYFPEITITLLHKSLHDFIFSSKHAIRERFRSYLFQTGSF